MDAITATRRTIRREWTTFGVLLILSVGLMGVSGTSVARDAESSVNFALSPIETVLNNAADTAGSYFSALTQIDRLRTQNEQLRQENLTLREQLNRMPAISHLMDDWTQITQAAAALPYRTTPARVIVRDISTTRLRTLILDKGSSDGLREGQVVIDAGSAIVGRIIYLDATVSTVLLLSDPTAVVVGKEAKTGATGTISGTIGGLLQMQYVEVSAKLQKGDAVVTAGETLPCTNDRSPYPRDCSSAPSWTFRPTPTPWFRAPTSSRPRTSPTPRSFSSSPTTRADSGRRSRAQTQAGQLRCRVPRPSHRSNPRLSHRPSPRPNADDRVAGRPAHRT